LRPDGDAACLRLCYAPDGDDLDALHAVLLPDSPADQERLTAEPALAVWSSRRLIAAGATDTDLVRSATFCAGRFDARALSVIEVGEGYARALGDWEPNERFAHGHRWLTD